MRISGRVFRAEGDSSFTERVECDLCGVVIFDRPPLLGSDRAPWPEPTVEAFTGAGTLTEHSGGFWDDHRPQYELCAKCRAVVVDMLQERGLKLPVEVEHVYPRCSECSGTGALGIAGDAYKCPHCNSTGFSRKPVVVKGEVRACTEPDCRAFRLHYGSCRSCGGTGFVDSEPKKP